MFETTETKLPGLLRLKPRLFRDQRGVFVKTYHEGTFAEMGLRFQPREEFFSTSAKGVLRGMHFQTPPVQHTKLVYCILGRVLDVVVDLRRHSETFGHHYAQELSGKCPEMLFIPDGFAHGFLSLEDDSVMVYQTSTVHSPNHDAGIRWDSFGFDWPVRDPILSERDQNFPLLQSFTTPF